MPKGIPNDKVKNRPPVSPVTGMVAPKRYKAFTVNRGDGGWVMTTYEIEGDKVVAKTSTEPDLRVLAIEAFKLAAVKWWNAQ